MQTIVFLGESHCQLKLHWDRRRRQLQSLFVLELVIELGSRANGEFRKRQWLLCFCGLSLPILRMTSLWKNVNNTVFLISSSFSVSMTFCL